MESRGDGTEKSTIEELIFAGPHGERWVDGGDTIGDNGDTGTSEVSSR